MFDIGFTVLQVFVFLRRGLSHLTCGTATASTKGWLEKFLRVNKVLVCMSFGCCDIHLLIMALGFNFKQNFRWFICNIASPRSRWSICCYVSNLQRNSWQAMQRLQCIFSMFGAEHEPPVQLNRTVQTIAQEFHGGCITASTATSSLWGMDGEWTGKTFPLGSHSLLCCGYYLPTN
jgi:hypothetical protein